MSNIRIGEDWSGLIGTVVQSIVPAATKTYEVYADSETQKAYIKTLSAQQSTGENKNLVKYTPYIAAAGIVGVLVIFLAWRR